MPLPNGIINPKINPLTNAPFIQNFPGINDAPPPGADFRITDSPERRITDSGDNRIID